MRIPAVTNEAKGRKELNAARDATNCKLSIVVLAKLCYSAIGESFQRPKEDTANMDRSETLLKECEPTMLEQKRGRQSTNADAFCV